MTGNNDRKRGAAPSLTPSHLEYLTPDGRDAEVPAQVAGAEARAVARDVEVTRKLLQALQTTLQDNAATTLKP